MNNLRTLLFTNILNVYNENVPNWNSSPVIDQCSIPFDGWSPKIFSFNVTADKSYILEIWLTCGCSNCDPCLVPENMLEKHFLGIFSSDETFIIQPTGNITTSNGTQLRESFSL